MEGNEVFFKCRCLEKRGRLLIFVGANYRPINTLLHDEKTAPVLRALLLGFLCRSRR